jgi:hypothetical protein
MTDVSVIILPHPVGFFLVLTQGLSQKLSPKRGIFLSDRVPSFRIVFLPKTGYGDSCSRNVILHASEVDCPRRAETLLSKSVNTHYYPSIQYWGWFKNVAVYAVTWGPEKVGLFADLVRNTFFF